MTNSLNRYDDGVTELRQVRRWRRSPEAEYPFWAWALSEASEG